MMSSTVGVTSETIQQELLRRHQGHLEELTRTLKKLGVSDSAIKQHVADILEEYEMEMRRSLNLN
jgi:hypothetical protein